MTEPTDSAPGLLAVTAAAERFFAEYPALAEHDIVLTSSRQAVCLGPRNDAPGAVEVLTQLAECLKATVDTVRFRSSKDGSQRVAFNATATYEGVKFYASAYVAAEPYETFAADHDPDPQAWTAAERAEYAAVAQHTPAERRRGHRLTFADNGQDLITAAQRDGLLPHPALLPDPQDDDAA